MDPYIGEIKAFPYNSNFIPQGWLLCDGQTHIIIQYQALFSIIGTSYGGNMQDGTFMVPNFQGYIPVGTGQGLGLSNYPLYAQTGTEQVTLTSNEIPSHNHIFNVATILSPGSPTQTLTTPAADTTLARPFAKANEQATTGNYGGNFAPIDLANGTLNPSALGPFPGAGGAHENRMPYVALTYFICYDGAYPVPND